MPESKRPVFLHVDMDGLWAVKQVYGLPEREDDFTRDPMYLEALPRCLDLLDQYHAPATFFVVGRDSQQTEKAQLLRQAVQAGHSLANHSMRHSIGMGAMQASEIIQDLRQANDAIQKTTGYSPKGFRAPGFDASPRILDAARQAGLLYDSSLLPSPWSGLLRGISSRFRRGKEASAARAGHYGAPGAGQAPRAPYHPDPQNTFNPGQSEILELPLAVTPRLRLPLYSTAMLAAGSTWTRLACNSLLAEKTDHPIVLLLHAIDFVDPASLADLPDGILARRVFHQPLAQKRALLAQALQAFQRRARFQSTEAWLDAR